MVGYLDGFPGLSDQRIDCVSQILDARADHMPSRSALLTLDDQLAPKIQQTYAEIREHALRIGSRLRSLDAHRVVIALSDPARFTMTFFGCLYAGAAAVPVCPPKNVFTAERMAAISKSADASLIVTSKEIAQILAQNVGAFLNTPVFTFEDLGDDAGSMHVDPRSFADDVVLIQFTSGSTSAPRGVMVTNRNLLHNIGLSHETWRPTDKTRILSWLPLYHDFGLIGCLLRSVAFGLPYVGLTTDQFLRDPLRWLRAISKYDDVISGAPNFAYSLCVQRARNADLSDLNLGGWRGATLGGEPVNPNTLFQFAQAFKHVGFSKVRSYMVTGSQNRPSF